MHIFISIDAKKPHHRNTTTSTTTNEAEKRANTLQPGDQCPYKAPEREMRSGPITY